MKKRIIVAIVFMLVTLHCYASAQFINYTAHRVVAVYGITNDFEMARYIVIYCDMYNVSVPLALAIAHSESAFDRYCISSNAKSSDIGVFQLNTKSYAKYTKKQLLDLETNVKFGIAHIAGALIKNKNNITKALITYNAGYSRVLSGKIPKSTLRYIDRVKKMYAAYAAIGALNEY